MANKTSRSSPDAHSSAIVEKYGLVSVDKYPRTVEHFLDLMWWEASRQPQTYKCWSAGTDTKGYVFLLFAHKWGEQSTYFTCHSTFCVIFARSRCLVLTCVLPSSTVHWGGSQLPHSHTCMHTTGLSPPRFPASWAVPHHCWSPGFWSEFLTASRERSCWVARHKWHSQVRQGCC